MTAITNNYNKPNHYTILMCHTVRISSFIFYKTITIYYILRQDYFWKLHHNFDIPSAYNPHNITIFTPVSIIKPTIQQLNSPFDLCCDPYYKSIKSILDKHAIVKPSINPNIEDPARFTFKPTKLLHDLKTCNHSLSFEMVKLTKNGSNGSRFKNLVI